MYADRVLETTSTAGTGAITTAGAVAGFRTFAAACAVGDTFDYTIFEVSAQGVPSGAWEVGRGTYTGANTIARTTVLASSNAGAAVDFAAGSKHVMLTVAAATLQGAVVVVDADDYTLLADDVSKYVRMVGAAAKTATVSPNTTTALPAGEWHIRNAGAGDLTIVAGSGVTINPPAGGTLVVPQNGTVTLKRISADLFDLLGQTVPV